MHINGQLAIIGPCPPSLASWSSILFPTGKDEGSSWDSRELVLLIAEYDNVRCVCIVHLWYFPLAWVNL